MEAGTISDRKEPSTPSSQSREILELAIPAMLAIASEPILALADTAMIGRLGVEPLAGRAIASALIGGIYWVFTFLIFGTTTLVGRHYGANEPKACGEIYLQAIVLATIGGIAVSSLCILFASRLYTVMGAEQAVLVAGASYFRTRMAATPLTFFWYATVGFLRGIQNTRTPMFIALFVNGFNIVLDYALIYGRFGFPAMGLQGAAIASVASQLIGASICIRLLFYSSYATRYGLTRWSLKPSRFRSLSRIGREIAVRTGALRFSLIFATATVARMGPSLLSSHEIAFQLWIFCSDTVDGLAVAGQALVAKYLGSNRAEKAYRLGKILILWGCATGFSFGLGYWLFKRPLINLFTKSPDVIQTLSTEIFPLLVLSLPLNGIVFVLDGILIGAHDTRFLMWAMLIGSFTIFIPITWLSLQFGLGLLGIWVGLSLFMVFRFCTNLFRLMRRRWAHAFAARGMEKRRQYKQE
ncbi:MAG: MATE family efflux transporter [Candidatus Binatia bacterium]